MAVSRYLTAHKISLLVLVNLYCDAGLPSSATIPVLSFIISHVVSTPYSVISRRKRVGEERQDVSLSIQAFEDVLQAHASSMPGRTLLDVFLKQLWEVNSFDALHDLFDNLGNVLVKTREEMEAEPQEEQQSDRIYLSKTSPLGAFVRRARLEFSRLQFDDAMKLWAAFVTYRAPTAQWTRRIAGLASSGFDKNVIELDLRPGDDLYEIAYGRLDDEAESELVSLDDMERILEFQLDRLQRQGGRVTDEMKSKLRNMLSPSGTAPRQSHLVRFFDAWKSGDYTSAFDNIHRYFDYAMQTREKIHYQYALLHMAILQADFGCFRESMATINEAIATARENQDLGCLNFSLSWLSHMSKAYPKQMKGAGYMGMLGSERDGLLFLKARARDSKMYSLLNATLLNEARLCMATAEPHPRALEHLYQASHLNIKENIGNYGGQMLLQSVYYSRLGISHLTAVYVDLVPDCYKKACAMDEHIRATGRSALRLTIQGQYDAAIQLFDDANLPASRVLKFNQFRYLSTGLVKLKRAIRRTDWQACTALLDTMKPDFLSDPDLTSFLLECRIEYLTARGHFNDAFNVIEDHAAALKDEGGDVLLRVNMLVAKAHLFAKIGKPERGFSVALRAASVSYKSRLMPPLWAAVGCLANILNEMGEWEAGRRLLDAVIPQALEHADQTLIATLYSYLADSYVGLAGQNDVATPAGARSRAANMSRAEVYIDRARECYKRLEDIDGECEQLMKKAIIARLRGDEELAEQWAQNHNRVWEEGKRGLVEA